MEINYWISYFDLIKLFMLMLLFVIQISIWSIYAVTKRIMTK